MKTIPWALVAYLGWFALMAYAFGTAIWFTIKNPARAIGWAVANVLGALLCWAFVSAIIGLYEISGYAAGGAFSISLVIGAAGAGLFGWAQMKLRRPVN